MIKHKFQRYAAVALTLGGLALSIHTPLQANPYQYCAAGPTDDIWFPGPTMHCEPMSQGECPLPVCEETRFAVLDYHKCAKSSIKCQKCVAATGTHRWLAIRDQHIIGWCAKLGSQCLCGIYSPAENEWMNMGSSHTHTVLRNCRTTNPCLGLN